MPAIALANGIEPEVFAAVRAAAAPKREERAREGGGLKVRYAGGLAPDMGLASLQALAGAVEGLAGHGVTLEIKTSAFWMHQGEAFAQSPATTVFTEEMSREAYQAWLAEADVVVIAYNFDSASLAYVRHSLANKLPECLASGAALLAIGPATAATMARLAEADCARRASSKGGSSPSPRRWSGCWTPRRAPRSPRARWRSRSATSPSCRAARRCAARSRRWPRPTSIPTPRAVSPTPSSPPRGAGRTCPPPPPPSCPPSRADPT